MKNLMIRLWKEEEGQDLVEYGLTVALGGRAVTTGMNSLATAINIAFSHVGSTLSSAVGGGGA